MRHDVRLSEMSGEAHSWPAPECLPDAATFHAAQSFTLLYRRLAVRRVFALVQRAGLCGSAAD